jgi:hypothetical protein
MDLSEHNPVISGEHPCNKITCKDNERSNSCPCVISILTNGLLKIEKEYFLKCVSKSNTNSIIQVKNQAMAEMPESNFHEQDKEQWGKFTKFQL